MRIVVKDGGRTVADAQGGTTQTEIVVPDARLWSPTSPHLYDLEITLFDEDGAVLDRVSSYAGIRSIGKRRDQDGHLRFTLNGEVIFQLGPLDQGWWPDGLHTPPSDEAMKFDLDKTKAMGFNMIRKQPLNTEVAIRPKLPRGNGKNNISGFQSKRW